MANSIKLSAAAAIAIAIILAALTWGVGSTHAEDTCETDAAADYLTALGIDAKTSKYDKGAGSPLDYANNGENDESACDAAEIVEPTPAPTAAPTPTPRATPEPQTRSAPAPATTPEPGTENTQQQQQQEDTAITRSSHLPQLSIAPATANEGDNLEFVITLSETSADNVSVTCTGSIESGDTAEDNDFTSRSALVTFQSTQTSTTCTVPTALTASHFEFEDTLTVTLSNPVNAIIAQATATGTIIDTTGFPIATFLHQSRLASESSGTINNFFCVDIMPTTGERSWDVTFEITGTATPGDDYVTLPTTLTVSRGQSQICIPITIINDNISEGFTGGNYAAETVIVRMVSANADFVIIGAMDTAQLNIEDNDDRPRITSIEDGTGYEGGQNDGTSSVAGQQFGNVNFRVNLSHPSAHEQCVEWSIKDQGATAGLDFPAASGTTTIRPLATSFYIQVPVIDDNILERRFASQYNETFEFSITGVCSEGISNFDLEELTATGTIVDNDVDGNNRNPTVTMASDTVTITEGEDIVIYIDISPPTGVHAPVFFGISDITTTKGVDYLAPHPIDFNIVLPEGATRAEVRLGSIDDDLVEGPETFSIGILRGGSTTIGAIRSATVTILDND